MIGIGIDTGGTYTDAVIYDLDRKEILAKGKTPTTHRELSIGILNAVDLLPLEQIQKAGFVALSTTLATNACLEGKGGRAKLIFIGMERSIVEENYKKYGLPHPDEIYFLDGSVKRGKVDASEPDWEQFRKDLRLSFAGYESVAITQLNAKENYAAYEKKAKKIIAEELGVPCITGFELFQELNVMRRGASALLNARLLPVIQEFLAAIRHAMELKEIRLPIVIVRSDGSVMSEKYAKERPIETLLCGPAASIRGAVELTNEKDGIILDMGGTTSDVAIIKDYQPISVTNGISIGDWKTFVQGLYVDTFGLGGDSSICRDEDHFYLDNCRVIPLCMTEQEYPQITGKLGKLNKEKHYHTKDIYQFLVRMKDITDHPNYTKEEQEICKALEAEPLMLTEAAQAVGKDIYSLKIARLEQEGVILRSGLTPTDIMHLKGDFDRFPKGAALEGAKYLAGCMHTTVEELSDLVYKLVKEKMYCNIVRILMQEKVEHGLDEFAKAAFENAYEHLEHPEYETGFEEVLFRTRASLIGIGAPVHVFLPDVAKMLGTKCVVPEDAPVANALGAVIGNVTAAVTIEIKPEVKEEEEFYIIGSEGKVNFTQLEEAKRYAEQQARELALQQAKEQGAKDHITVTVEMQDHEASTNYGGCLYLGTDVTAHAIGKLAL